MHLHHFNYGIILLVLGLMLTFLKALDCTDSTLIFGLGLGLIVDEYWLLLTFDEHANAYFVAQSQFLSLTIAKVVTLIYAGIALGVFFNE